MKLLIRIKNNQPIGNPIAFDNILLIHPDADYDNPPMGFAKFNRVLRPIPKPFQHVSTTPIYVYENGIVQDHWDVTEFTNEERQQKIEEVRLMKPFDSWNYIPEELRFESPVSYPSDGGVYKWDEPSLSWKEVAIPTDNTQSL